MRDEHGCALVACKRELELFDRLEVEVVRRLVEHERIDSAGGEQRDRGTASLSR